MTSVMMPRSSLSADHELVEVVAGDVLDDLATGFGDGSIGEDDGHADDKIAETAILQAETAGIVRCNDAAHCGVVWVERIEGYELAVLGKRGLQGVPVATCLDDAGQVLPCVLCGNGVC